VITGNGYSHSSGKGEVGQGEAVKDTKGRKRGRTTETQSAQRTECREGHNIGGMGGGLGLMIGMTRGCAPGFLRKSAQPVERRRDSCDPKNERVRKCLKTRREECEELVTRANEQRGEVDRGGVRTIRRG